LRKAAARTVETVCAAIAQLLGALTRRLLLQKRANLNALRGSTTTGVPILTLS
jgi:hypothetical protein